MVKLMIMCFSATASFAAGVALSAAGVATLKQVRTGKEYPLAAIPLLFGIQQITEGFVWLSLGNGDAVLNAIATYIYYIFAHIWWPIFVPIAIALIEPVPRRKRAILMLEIPGLVIAAYFAHIMTIGPIVSRVLHESIVYSHPGLYVYPMLALYVVVVCGSCLLSSRRLINLLGLLLIVSFAICFVFYFEVLASVWCFFAALLSGIIYLYFRKYRSSDRKSLRG